jgi:1-acyl-sn-glycerol-3-phosphate acyltransferase
VNQANRFWYRAFVGAIRCYQKLFWDFRVFGRERIPPGPKIYVSNHITSVDHYWVMLVCPEPVHMIVGPGYQPGAMARVLRYFEQINAMPEHRDTVVNEACRYLALGEPVYIAPEGDLQPTFQLGRFFTGVAKIYRKSRAPIVPIALVAPRSCMRRHPRWDLRVGDRVFPALIVWRGPVCVNVGEPFSPALRDDLSEEDDNRRITDEVRERIRSLTEEVRSSRFWLNP